MVASRAGQRGRGTTGARQRPRQQPMKRWNQARHGYKVTEEGRLQFARLKDEVKFASATAAVRSALEHHQELLRSWRSEPGASTMRSFIAVVCKDAAKAGGYRLCMRYFGPRLPSVVPWAIDALVRGETLARGLQELLNIGRFPLDAFRLLRA